VDENEAKHVCFEGTEQLAFGTYGTSIPLTVAMDKCCDVMIAYEMNGKKRCEDKV
jgi:DMSO/TMAO reductase YedYZ molybdopterin-dependent catalytic subunit